MFPQWACKPPASLKILHVSQSLTNPDRRHPQRRRTVGSGGCCPPWSCELQGSIQQQQRRGAEQWQGLADLPLRKRKKGLTWKKLKGLAEATEDIRMKKNDSERTTTSCDNMGAGNGRTHSLSRPQQLNRTDPLQPARSLWHCARS